jgi:hypothetical protein
VEDLGKITSVMRYFLSPIPILSGSGMSTEIWYVVQEPCYGYVTSFK